MDERPIFDRFHDALDVQPRPGAFDRLESALAKTPVAAQPREPIVLRLPETGRRVAALVLLAVLGAVAIGVFFATHQPTVPVRPGGGPVIFPTKMVSATTGWAVVAATDRAKPSELWRTTDGGTTWSDVSPPSLTDRRLGYSDTSEYFLDGTHAWVSETGGASASDAHVVSFRTTDGGQTWQQGALISINRMSPYIDALQMDFIDADNGWLLLPNGDPFHFAWPTLYSTHDGGIHWTLTASSAGSITPLGGLMPGAASMVFSSAATGWLVVGLFAQIPNGQTLAREVLLVTHDGGSTWQVQPLPVTAPTGSALGLPTFFDALHGIIVPHGVPVLLATSDGGSTWSARPLPGELQMVVDFVDPNHGWAVAGSAAQLQKNRDAVDTRKVPLPLYHTGDGGLTWVSVQNNIFWASPAGQIFDLYFVDQQTGFASLINSNGPSQVLRTMDGGRTWTVVEICRASLGLENPPRACPRSS